MHTTYPKAVRRSLPVLLLAVLLCTPSGGCVIRRMTINTNVPGAAVYVDDQIIGTTPASAPFTYYGTRRITIIPDGYETLTVYHTFERPWYEYPVIEFFSESLWPWEIDDLHELYFELTPQQVVPAAETVARAETLRENALQGIVAPLPDQLPGAIGPPPILPAPGTPTQPGTPGLPTPAVSHIELLPAL